MMNAVWRLAVIGVALILTTCSAFLVSPAAGFAVTRPRAAATTQTHHVLRNPAFAAAGACIAVVWDCCFQQRDCKPPDDAARVEHTN